MKNQGKDMESKYAVFKISRSFWHAYFKFPPYLSENSAASQNENKNRMKWIKTDRPRDTTTIFFNLMTKLKLRVKIFSYFKISKKISS